MFFNVYLTTNKYRFNRERLSRVDLEELKNISHLLDAEEAETREEIIKNIVEKVNKKG